MNICVIVLMLVAVFFATIAQRNKIMRDIPDGDQCYIFCYHTENKWCYILSFLILATILFLSKNGVDLPGYLWGYENWDIYKFQDLGTEWGYTLSVLFLKSFIKNPYIGLGIIKLVSILLFYVAAFRLRDRINLGLTTLAYCCLLYIYSFHLLRMMIAIGIVFLALSYEILGSSKRCVLLLVLAFFFHYTSIVVLASYILVKTCRNKLSIMKVFVLLVASSVVLLSINGILQVLISRVSFFYKYVVYLDKTDAGGIGLILIYIPVILLIMFYNRYELEDNYYVLFSVMGIMLFDCSLAGFYLPITRLNYYFYSFFFFYVAAFPMKNERIYFKIGNKRIGAMSLLMIFYFVYSFISYLIAGGLESNGLSAYTFIWN